MKYMKYAVFIFALVTATQSAGADDLIGSYVAVIGRDDLYNSRGQRLTEPWQILRQDRANYHRFRLRDPGDTGDDFFASAKNREIMERMLKNGRISRRAAQILVNGYAEAVLVRIYGRGNRGKHINVTVLE